MEIKLHQFAVSHFNEKARWALAYKNVLHEKITYLPGPHIPAIKRLSGQTATPVLEIDGEPIPGTAQILARLEQTFPSPTLYPETDESVSEALALQKEFDDIVGPAVRTVVFSVLVNEGSYLVRMFGGTKSLPKRLAYRASFPIARGMIAKGNGVTPENVERCFGVTQDALDRIADRISTREYMVGDRFSIADLTVAALFAPIASVDHIDMKRPEPIPAAMQQLVDRYKDHATIAWVNEIYRKHRP